MPDTATNNPPGVSYVMPVLNDVTHVAAAVESLLNQDYSGSFDVTIALAPSIDGTEQLVKELAQRDPRITIVPNPEGSTPAGLNLAIAASAYPIVVRVDAHSVLPPDYTRVAVETLRETGAENVGGIMDAKGTTPFERAVARAYGSPVGLGGTKLHVGGQPGPAETVYLGVFQREALERVGLFDEDIKRGQDWELNQRLRAHGGTVWFTPRLRVIYRPRANLYRLARQFFSTGAWRGELTKRFPSNASLRYLAPPLMVLSVVFGILLGIAGIIPAVFGATPWLLWGFALPVLYLVGVIVATCVWGRGDGIVTLGWFPLVVTCIHFSWGIGFLLEFFSLTRSITSHTGR